MVDLAATIWRDFETDGLPQTGAHKPLKVKIREWGASVENPDIADVPALLALDTSKRKSAFLNTASRQGRHDWNGANLSGTLLELAVTSTTVDSVTDTVTAVAHGFNTAMPVIATTAVNGLALNTLYYIIRVTADTFRLATSSANATAGTALDLTGTTNFSVRKHRDPGKKVYVTPTTAIDGSTGAWVRTGTPLTGSPWEDVTVNGKTARIHRVADRLMIADAVGYDGFQKTGASGTWLEKVGAGATKMDYSILNAGLASVTSRYVDSTIGGTSGYAILGAARHNGTQTGSAIGLFGIGYNDGTTGGAGTNAWGAYVEGIVNTAANRVSVGCEVEITNTAQAFAGNVSPYIGFFTGMNGGIFVGCGGGVGVNPTTFHSHFGIMFGENGQIGSSSFHRGMVFNNNSLVRDGGTPTGLAHAILLPPNAAIEWYEAATESVGARITGHVLDAAHRQTLFIDDAGMHLRNDANVILFWARWVASAVNAPRLSPSVTGGPVVLEFTGSDVNGSVAALGKGTGGVMLRDGGNINKIQVNTTGIGFFATAPIAKPTVAAAATDAATTQTLANSIRTILINYGLAA